MNRKKLNIAFAGTPEFAAVHLKQLIDAGYSVSLVYSQPDRPAGRGHQIIPSPVKQVALDHGIPVRQPKHLKSEEEADFLKKQSIDLMIVVAYGLLIPPNVLSIPTLGCINVHASRLPRWRGAAPIQRAIEAGDSMTGITIMQMDEGLDTGGMLLQTHCEITRDETAGSLYKKLEKQGRQALIDALEKISQGLISPQRQDNNLATYAKKITKIEAALDWGKTAEQLALQVRAFNPRPISYFLFSGEAIRVWEAEPLKSSSVSETASEAPVAAEKGTIINLSQDGLDVATQSGALRIKRLQIPGKRAIDINEFLAGHRNMFAVGTIL